MQNMSSLKKYAEYAPPTLLMLATEVPLRGTSGFGSRAAKISVTVLSTVFPNAKIERFQVQFRFQATHSTIHASGSSIGAGAGIQLDRLRYFTHKAMIKGRLLRMRSDRLPLPS